MCENLSKIQIFLIPSYIFLLSSILRLFSLNSEQGKISLPIKTAVWFDDDNYSPIDRGYQNANKSFSFLLKIAISQLLSLIGILECFLAIFLKNNELFEIPCDIFYVIFALIKILSWWMSAQLLRKEKENELPQTCYTHRFFWFNSFLFQIIETFTAQVFFSIYLFMISFFRIT